jgi:ABC-type molybdate transport system permease subunit
LISSGRIEQVGAPAAVYEHPATTFVAGFIGVPNVLERDGRRFMIRPEKIRILRAFRDITFPQMRSALIAGALLAFALSFDEVIVTTFTAGDTQTLPIWILNNLSRPRNLPIVNVVAFLVVLLSIVPVYIAQRLSEDVTAPGAAVRDIPAA